MNRFARRVHFRGATPRRMLAKTHTLNAPAEAQTIVPPSAEVACLCTGVTFEQIADHRSTKPNISLEDLGAALGCGQQCGSCLPHLAEALGEIAWYPAQVEITPLSQAASDQAREHLIYEVALTIDSGDYPISRPGQHVVLKATVDDTPVERTYTVVEQSSDGRELKLAIRRIPSGVLTPALLRDEVGHSIALEVSAPNGPGFMVTQGRPVVFFAGGIGVTPAVALLENLPDDADAHLDYSATTAQDVVYRSRFERLQARIPGFSAHIRLTESGRRITDRDVTAMVRQWPKAQFYVCGPTAYVIKIQDALLRAGVPPASVRIELFSMGAASRPKMSFRAKLYVAAGAILLLALSLVIPRLENQRPHGHPNVGHAELKCAACHTDAPGSTRQVLQAKAKHLLGLRETGAVFGKLPVTNAVCVQCHANPDDRHPANRFLEPRFDEARESVGPQMCVSCHREHSDARVTIGTTTFCVQCHQELKVRNDPIRPTHATILQEKAWNTCMQCHDYHGNHTAKVPLNLRDAADLGAIARYMAKGPSPYGATVVKAKKDPQ
jgi:ferredoxin-NADP reductase/bacterioferritin-associated ferredoxin